MGTRSDEVMLLLASLGVGFYLAASMPVFAQESYYWCYSEHPDLSYYDHPPMVAWLIWLGTSFFGDGALGIRFGTLLCGSCVVLSGIRLLRDLDATPAARRAWLLLSLAVPSLLVTRFLANPDPPLCAFWMLTLLALWRARSGETRWWLAAGFLAGCALLSKYTAIFLCVGGVIVLLADPMMRRQLVRPGPWLGVAVAALTFSPVMLWNVGNDFESFRFQTEGRWKDAELGLRWFGQFVGGQLLVLNPVVTLGMMVSSFWLWQRTRARDCRAIWMLAFSLPMVGFLLFSSMFVQVKINWLIPAALPLLLGLSWWWGDETFRFRKPRAATYGARAALSFGLLPLLAPLVVLVPQRRGSTWTGWEEIAARAMHWESSLDDADGVDGNVFFFAGDYRDAAQLTRHLKIESAGAGAAGPTLAQNAIGRTALQFDHWTDPRDRIGQDAIFVLPRPDRRRSLVDLVTERFDCVEFIERVKAERLGVEVLVADLYLCHGYRGPQP